MVCTPIARIYVADSMVTCVHTRGGHVDKRGLESQTCVRWRVKVEGELRVRVRVRMRDVEVRHGVGVVEVRVRLDLLM